MNIANKYIYKDHELYRIRYKGEHYGSFSNIEVARKERDLLIYYNWDWDLLCDLGDSIENTDIEIRPENMNYIHVKKSKKKITYYVNKRIGNKTVTFAKYSDKEKAKKYRDFCVANNWDLKKCLT